MQGWMFALIVGVVLYGLRAAWIQNNRRQGRQPKRMSKAAVWSLIVGILCIGNIAAGVGLYFVISSNTKMSTSTGSSVNVFDPQLLVFQAIGPALAIVLGLFGLRNIRARHGAIAGTKSAITGIICGSLTLAVMAVAAMGSL